MYGWFLVAFIGIDQDGLVGKYGKRVRFTTAFGIK